MTEQPRLTRWQIRQIAVKAFADERTVTEAYRDPSRKRESTLLRISCAAKALGLPEPVAPDPQTPAQTPVRSMRSELSPKVPRE